MRAGRRFCEPLIGAQSVLTAVAAMPKDVKRAAPKAAAPKAAKKKAKTAPAPVEQPVAAVKKVSSELQAVLSVINSAPDLSDDCRAMLREAASRSLSMGASERSKVHAMFVGWIEEVVSAQLTRLQDAVVAANAEVEEIESGTKQLENELAERTGALDVAKEALASRKQSVSNVLEQITTTRLQVSEAHAAHRNAQSTSTQTKSDKDQLDEALRDRVPALKDGCEPAVASGHVKALLPLAQRMSLDESFLNALPASGLKPVSDRGNFDNTVLNALQDSLREKAAEFAIRVDEHEKQVDSKKSAVEALEAELALKHRHNQELEACLAVDNDALKAAAEAADSASNALDAFKASNAAKLASRSAKVEALEGFKAYEVECFALLRDKKTLAEIAEELAAEKLAAEKLAAEKAAAAKIEAERIAVENEATEMADKAAASSGIADAAASPKQDTLLAAADEPVA